MRSPEIGHYSTLLADLTIAAARATTIEQLAAIREQMREAYAEMFSLLSHDALDAHDLVADLLGHSRRGGAVLA